MGADHLGVNRPSDTFMKIKEGANFGWPYCYQAGSKVYPDPKFNPRAVKLDCRKLPLANTAFEAHSAPLGFEYFGPEATTELHNSYLVALHGSTRKSLGRGYKLVRVPAASPAAPQDFLTGFFRVTKLMDGLQMFSATVLMLFS